MDRVLPSVIDSGFEGHVAAIWLLALFVVIRILMSIGMIVRPRAAASGPDGIPIDSFDEPAARRFLTLFAMLGVCQLALALVGVLALVRYPALIPLACLLFLAELLVRRLLLLARPLAKEGPLPLGFFLNLGLLALLATALALSLG